MYLRISYIAHLRRSHASNLYTAHHITNPDTMDISVNNFSKDLIYPVKIPDPVDYTMIEYGQRGGIKRRYEIMVDYLKDCGIVYEDRHFYRFDGCIYAMMTDDDVKNLLHLALDEYTTQAPVSPPFDRVVLKASELNDILNKLKAVSTIDRIPDVDLEEYTDNDPETEMFDEEPASTDFTHLIPFRNGIYNIKTNTLLPFTPGLFFTK